MTKVKCSKCGQYHDIYNAEISFKYPDAYGLLGKDERGTRTKIDDNFCKIDQSDYFVKALLRGDTGKGNRNTTNK
jgi:hypothetical protein